MKNKIIVDADKIETLLKYFIVAFENNFDHIKDIIQDEFEQLIMEDSRVIDLLIAENIYDTEFGGIKNDKESQEILEACIIKAMNIFSYRRDEMNLGINYYSNVYDY